MSDFDGTRVSPDGISEDDMFQLFDGPTNVSFEKGVRYQFVRHNGKDIGIAVSTSGREDFRADPRSYFFSGSAFFYTTGLLSGFPTVIVDASGNSRTI